jgi:hypothetical protein
MVSIHVGLAGSLIFVITSGYGLLNIVHKKKKKKKFNQIKRTACSGFLRIFKEPEVS